MFTTSMSLNYLTNSGLMVFWMARNCGDGNADGGCWNEAKMVLCFGLMVCGLWLMERIFVVWNWQVWSFVTGVDLVVCFGVHF